MGGQGSGRPPSADSILRNSRQPQLTPIGTEIFIPNHSGQHDAGTVHKTPVNDDDIVNKVYVDTFTADHPHQDVTTTAVPEFAAMSLGKTNDVNTVLDLKTLNASRNKGMRIEADNASNIQFSTYVTGDSQVRFFFEADGDLYWGSGAAVADTKLYRGSANVLQTDDTFRAPNYILESGGSIKINSDSVAGMGFADDAGNRIFSVDTSNNRIGIGTATPSYDFTLEGAGGTGVRTILSVKQLSDGSGHAGGQLSLVSKGWGEWGFYAGDPTSDTYRYFYAAGGYTNFKSSSSGIQFVGTSESTKLLTIDDTSGIGVGSVTSPTARLHLPACTATANTASLKIDAGTVATAAVSGNIESDGTHLYWTDSGGTRRQLDN